MFAGSGSGTATADGTAALSTKFKAPRGLWGDSNGLFVADYGNGYIRRISWSTSPTVNPVYKYAGGGSTAWSSTTGSVATTAVSLTNPYSIWGDGDDSYYITDSSRVYKITISTGNLIGITPSNSFTYSTPVGLAGDGLGNLYFTDSNRINKIDLSSNQVTTIAGPYTSGIISDGDYASTSLKFFDVPVGLLIRGNTVYFPDGSEIRSLTPNAGGTTWSLKTVAGSTPGGYKDGAATSALFNSGGKFFWADTNNNLFVGDSTNACVRRVTYFTKVITGRRRLTTEEYLNATTKTNGVKETFHLRRII
jgi:hypothetical protein